LLLLFTIFTQPHLLLRVGSSWAEAF